MSIVSGFTNCVRCKSYLFNEDDVVYCPVCGAPHHRECYNALGHCALEEFHGTENEYSRNVQEEKNQTENVKPETPQKSSNLEGTAPFITFDFLGGVPADADLGDGVAANEVKNFVFANTHRYIPKFFKLKGKNKFSWNWMAFLFPAGWMMSRKMYKSGIITAILTIAVNCLSYPLSLALYNLGYNSAVSYNEQIESMMEILPQISTAVIGLAFLGGILDLIIRLAFALIGDFMYRNHAIATIKKIKTESEDKANDYRKKGGVSTSLFFLTVLFVRFGYSMIIFFL